MKNANAQSIAKGVILGMLRERHNAFADVEEFCTGTAAKLKRYAPLLRHVAMLKEDLRRQIQAVDKPFGDEGRS